MMSDRAVFQAPAGVVGRQAGAPADGAVLALVVVGIILSTSVPVLRLIW